LLWSSSDSESDSSSEDDILPLKSIRNCRLIKAPTKSPAESNLLVKKESRANKVVVLESSDSECTSDEGVSRVQFPIKCLAQSTPKVPKLKQEGSNENVLNVSDSEDSGSFSIGSCDENFNQLEGCHECELNNLHEISQPKSLSISSESSHVPSESTNVPSESLKVPSESSKVSQESSNLPILQPQEQSNHENSGLNRTFIFNNKVLIETPGCYIYQEELDKAAEYSQYLEDWLDSVTD